MIVVVDGVSGDSTGSGKQRLTVVKHEFWRVNNSERYTIILVAGYKKHSD